MKLTETEESVIIQHILDLDARGFPPQLAAVKDMADSLLSVRHQDPVGVNWPSTFVKRTSERKVKFNQKYDYKRVECVDPEIIEGGSGLWRTRKQSTASPTKTPTTSTKQAS